MDNNFTVNYNAASVLAIGPSNKMISCYDVGGICVSKLSLFYQVTT